MFKLIRRLFWFGSGIGVGVWGSYRANQAAKRLAPDHVARRAAEATRKRVTTVRAAVDEGRSTMRSREAELEAELRAGPPTHHQ